MNAASHRSILDRLRIDLFAVQELGSRSEAESILDSIAGDLEILLNVRRRRDLIPPQFEEAATSILNFGIEEFDLFGDLRNPIEQERLCNSLESIIETFEPRLVGVRVQLVPSGITKHRLHLRIQGAVVSLDEQATFEADFARTSSRFSVRGGGR
jgi:type VI secretion system lysozyme-like protein